MRRPCLLRYADRNFVRISVVSMGSPRGSLPEKSARPLRPFLLHGRPTSARFPTGLHPVRRRCLVVRRRPTDVASGTLIRRDSSRSLLSCSISRVAAARYSSQIACTRAGSRYVSVYSALTSGPRSLGQMDCQKQRPEHPRDISPEAVLSAREDPWPVCHGELRIGVTPSLGDRYDVEYG